MTLDRSNLIDSIGTCGHPRISDPEAHQGPAVYFIHAAPVNQVKIGYSERLRARLGDLMTASSVKLKLLFAFSVESVADEKAFHDRFAIYRSHREWFTVEGHLASFIIEVLTAAPAVDAAPAKTTSAPQEDVEAESYAPRLNASDASRYLLSRHGLRVSESKLNALSRSGEDLSSFIFGARRHFEVSDLDRWAASAVAKAKHRESERRR